VTPLEVDASCTAERITLSRLRSALPADVFRLSPRRAWFGLARACATVAAGELLLANVHVEPSATVLWQIPALLLGWFVVMAGMGGFFIIGHDCGHEAFSRRRWVNSLIGHVCMSPNLTSFHGWRLSHAHHHARAQLRGDDTDWPEQMLTHEEYARAPRLVRVQARAAYGSPVGLMVGFFVGMIRRTAMRRLYPQVKLGARARRELSMSTIVVFLTCGAMAVTLLVTMGTWAMLKHYLIPLYLGMVTGAFFTYLHHSGEGALVFDEASWTPVRGQVVSTFDVRFPVWLEVLFFHINRHPAHHLSPRIPWYNLPRAMDALRQAHPSLHIERRFSPGYLLRAWRAPLLAETSPGVFVAAPPVER